MSARCGEVRAPCCCTARDPAATAYRRPVARSSPPTSAATNAPRNASPAPTVSTAATTGRRRPMCGAVEDLRALKRARKSPSPRGTPLPNAPRRTQRLGRPGSRRDIGERHQPGQLWHVRRRVHRSRAAERTAKLQCSPNGGHGASSDTTTAADCSTDVGRGGGKALRSPPYRPRSGCRRVGHPHDGYPGADPVVRRTTTGRRRRRPGRRARCPRRRVTARGHSRTGQPARCDRERWFAAFPPPTRCEEVASTVSPSRGRRGHRIPESR